MEDCKRVLVADDEDDITWAISRCLTSADPVIEVECASTGDQAHELLQKNSYDLLISDLRMPGCDGLKLTLEARRLHPETKVIIMTAYGSQEVMARTESFGSFFYLEKPFEIGYLKQLSYEALGIQTGGFDGALNGACIRELIELSCARRSSLSLFVSRNEEKGAIYFRDGDVVHAECGLLRGERAFFNMLNWSRGTFRINHDPVSSKRTISRDWRMLLHQGA